MKANNGRNEQRPFSPEPGSMKVGCCEPRATIQIERQSLQVFTQADIDRQMQNR